MITTLVILSILAVFVIGFVWVYKRHLHVVKKLDFAGEYRDQFIDFANKYLENFDSWSRSGTYSGEQYAWLTMNVSKIQSDLGRFGVLDFIAPFQTYRVPNYQIVINTIPKFRDGSIKDVDIYSVDDCLLRYIGHLQGDRKDTHQSLKNPIVWFREGFREILSVPIFILSSFEVISKRTVILIKDSLVYKGISGFIALVTLVSGIVTIIVGYDQAKEFVLKLFGI